MWEKGPGALAALAIVLAAPWIVIAPFSGVLVDRWRRTLAAFAAASHVSGFPHLVALLGVPTVLVGLAVARWLPARRMVGVEDSSLEGPRS